MHVALPVESQEAHASCSYTIRPKPDRRKAPRISLEPGTSLIGYVRQLPPPTVTLVSAPDKPRDVLAAL